MTNYRKKLIEVALPLEAINVASAREKSIRHGHPSTLHLWWARRPLAACRAVLFASLVDDPDSDPSFRRADGAVDEDRAGVRRTELFNLVEELVRWENSNNESVLNRARAEIAASVASRKVYDTKEWSRNQNICGETAWAFVCRTAKPPHVQEFLIAHGPPVLDPFCGGGSIPLEAQRLGLRAFGSDLNPVPVLITKALIEIPPKFANQPPVNPESNARLAGGWKGAQGLAEDVRYYGQWMRDQAERRIGHLYPKIKITEEMVWGPIRGAPNDSPKQAHRPETNIESGKSGEPATAPGRGSRAGCLTPAAENQAGCPAPVTENRAGCPDPIADSRARCPTPVAQNRAGCPAPVAENRARCPTPVAESRAGCPAPVTESRAGGLTPIAESRAGCPTPVAQNQAGGSAPVAESRARCPTPVTENRAGCPAPVAESRAGCPTPIRPDLKPYLGQELTVIAWIWARTVASPNPAVGGTHVPLVRSFWLSTKKGKEAWVEPIVDRKNNSYWFEVRVGKPPEGFDPGQGTIVRNGGKCLISDGPMPFEHVRAEGKAGRMAAKLVAIVAEGARGRVYLNATPEQEAVAIMALPAAYPDTDLPKKALSMRVMLYGMDKHYKLFTARQLTALTTFSDLVKEAREKVLADADGGQDGRPPKGFYRRGAKHPPHFDQPGKMQHVTFRLAGSLPAECLARAKQELESGSITSDQYREKLEAELDRGHGPDWLVRPEIAEIVVAALKHFDGQRYDLHTWCVMPNHVHVLFTPRAEHRLADLVHSWKSFTAKKCNTRLDRSGPFWQDDYFDRYMRDWADIERTSAYIMNNGGRASVSGVDGKDVGQDGQTPLGGKDVGQDGQPPLGGKDVGQDGQPPLGGKDVGQDGQTPLGGKYVGQDGQPPLAGKDVGQDGQPPFGGKDVGQDGRPPLGDPKAYADAVATYLAFAVDKCTDYWSNLCSWHSSGEKMRNTFGRQALPMVWDYAECCPFSGSTGNWNACLEWVAETVARSPAGAQANVVQRSAVAPGSTGSVISTDPPYYDNIGYADLSDFFYVWLRRSLGDIYPDLFKTLLTPKAEELIATPYRHGGDKHKAQKFFESGLGQAFHRMREVQPAEYPMTVFYAFKQSEDCEDEMGGGQLGRQTQTPSTQPTADNPGLEVPAQQEPRAGGTPTPPFTSQASTGWETMLAGLIDSGFAITGTWPMRTELGNRMVGSGTNALASSIVLACRPRAADAPVATRREFLAALKGELPGALHYLQAGNIAPVDLAQASIGPGMAIFTRYAKVMEADGSSMSVRTALGIINQMLDEVLAEQEGEFDAETRWAVAWFEQFGMEAGPFGEAETLSRAKNTAVNGLVDAGIVAARAGKVQLLKRSELRADWNPGTDKHRVHWEITQHLIRALENEGESAAANLVRQLGGGGEPARDLAYRLYNMCERKKWAREGMAYNGLVIAWSEISRLARAAAATPQTQERMF